MRKSNLILHLAVAAALTLCPSLVRAAILGFGGNGQSGWTSNHAGTGAAASVSGVGDINDVLTITSADNGDANSYFFNTLQPLTTGGWNASFTYQYPSTGTGTPADGATFTLQNDPRGPSALGSAGGALGYAGAFSSSPSNGNGITSSESMQLNLFTGSPGGPGILQSVNAGGEGSGGVYTPVTPIALNSQSNPINVSLSYDGLGTLTESMTETNTGNVVTKTVAVPSVQQVLGGGNTFYVGFTGSTGGLNAAQQISNFSFTPAGAQVAKSLNIFKYGDPVSGVNAVPGAGTGANSPSAEQAPNAIDSAQPSKYLNFNTVAAGILVSPAVGSTVATELGLTSANDSPERDPASYEVWGTNDTNLSDTSPALNPGGWQNFWTLIANGAVPAFSLRGQEQDISFSNNSAYSSYLVDFPVVANPGSANSMQVADIQLSGAAVPEPGTVALMVAGAVGALLFLRRRG